MSQVFIAKLMQSNNSSLDITVATSLLRRLKPKLPSLLRIHSLKCHISGCEAQHITSGCFIHLAGTSANVIPISC